MAQKVLINGSAYELAAGKVVKDGTAYSVEKGRTLVGGTGYDIKLGVMRTVTFAGSSGATTYVKINGERYTGSSKAIEIEAGTTCTIIASSGTKRFAIIIDGETVSNKSGNTNYTYTINNDCRIMFSMGSITITTS